MRLAVLAFLVVLAGGGLPSTANARTVAECANPDPKRFDQVLACMSSLQREGRGGREGRQIFDSGSIRSCDSATTKYLDALKKSGIAMERAGRMVPSCGMLARGIKELSGDAPDWAACADYPGRFDGAHMSACLRASGGSRRSVSGCDDAIRTYERALKTASVESRTVGSSGRIDFRSALPESYRPPSCEQVAKVIGGSTAVAQATPGSREAVKPEAPAVKSGAAPVVAAPAPPPAVVQAPRPPPVAPTPQPEAATPPVAKAPEPARPVLASAIQQCDALSAHPDDPEAVGRGVADKALDARAAITACEAAIKLDPQTPRLQFQLARGYLKAGRTEDCIEQLIAAARQDHGGALAYLADLHVDGVPGIEADPLRAKALYEKAVASGFQPAKTVLAEFEDKTADFETSEKEERVGKSSKHTSSPFRFDHVIEPILLSHMPQIDDSERAIKLYLSTVLVRLGELCPAQAYKWQTRLGIGGAAGAMFFNPMHVSRDVALGQIGRAMSRPESKALTRSNILGELSDEKRNAAAIDDAQALLGVFSCGDERFESFRINALGYIQNRDANAPTSKDILLTCVKDEAFANVAQQIAVDRCACFATNFNVVPYTRIERQALMKPGMFWKNATKIKKEWPLPFEICPV